MRPSGRLPPVKVSFFGGVDTGRVGEPLRTDDGVVLVASLLDLLGTKLKVLLQRVAARDYLDLAAILRSGVPSKTDSAPPRRCTITASHRWRR